MKLYDVLWTVTGGIVLIAVATKTDIIRNFLSEVKGGYSYDDEDGYDCGFDQLVQEQYPSIIKSQYQPSPHLCFTSFLWLAIN